LASLSKNLNPFNTCACGRIVVGKLSAVSLAIILESLFFGREYDFRIWVSLLLIVAGVALTSVT
jgi:uncharacterized membrane protein